MGRPINKNKIGQGVGKIQVTRHFFTGAAEATTTAWIVSQRSGNKFKVTDGSTTEILTLVNKAAGNLVAGEMSIDAVLDDSTVVQVTKLYNRKVQYEGGTANVAVLKYVVGAGGNADDAVVGTATVDGQ